jgi:hypothetical protein
VQENPFEVNWQIPDYQLTGVAAGMTIMKSNGKSRLGEEQ